MKLPGGESLKMGLDLSRGLRSHTDVEYFSLTLSFYYSGTQNCSCLSALTVERYGRMHAPGKHKAGPATAAA